MIEKVYCIVMYVGYVGSSGIFVVGRVNCSPREKMGLTLHTLHGVRYFSCPMFSCPVFSVNLSSVLLKNL